MRVGELLANLSRLDQSSEVLCYTEDGTLLAEGHVFRLLGIESVEEFEGVRVRGEDLIPTVRLGKSPQSQKFVFLNVVSEF